MPNRRTPIQTPDELDILSAIWIVSCNDEIPEMTYEGIKYRLGLEDSYDVQSLINSRGEMFRAMLPKGRLDVWKQEMLEGKRLPSWIRDKGSDAERKEAINALGPDDVFRNQFRAEPNAPRATVEIINWGLEHIDRLRKANAETRKEKSERVRGFWIPLLSTITALVAVVTNGLFQNMTLSSQEELKYYEVELKPKQDNYADFMRALTDAYDNARNKNDKGVVSSLDKLEVIYYRIEPFLIGPKGDRRARVWEQYQSFSATCYQLSEAEDSPDNQGRYADLFIEYRKSFREELYTALFSPVP